MNIDYENMVVIFIDLLGSKALNDFTMKYKIHRIFHEELALNQAKQKNIQHVIYDRKIFSFSDCAYVFYFYKPNLEEHRKKDIELIKVAILNSIPPIIKIMLEGHFLRGGISFGKCFIDDLGFFGPAVNRAYEIESTMALYPIIQLDDDIGEEIYKEQKHQNDEHLDILFKWKPSIVNEKQGKYFLNYLYQFEIQSNLTWGKDVYNYDDVKCRILTNIEKNKFKNINNQKILDKMEFIKNVILDSRQGIYEDGVIPFGGFLE